MGPVRIGVITGSSATGAACIKKLLSVAAQDVLVRGCFRTQERADQFGPSTDQYESYVGVDASNLGSLEEGLAGCQRAVLVTPLDYSAGLAEDANKSIRMIQAAQNVGVEGICHVGSWTVNAPDHLPILSARFKPAEDYLRDVVGDSMKWTVLRGGYFMANFLHVHGSAIRDRSELLPCPNVSLPPVDTRDIGEAAAMLMIDPTNDHHRQFIECCGPQVLAHSEIAEEIGKGIGRDVQHPTPMELDKFCELVNVPIMTELFRYFTDPTQKGVPADCGPFQKVLGREPTTLQQWSKENKAVFTN